MALNTATAIHNHRDRTEKDHHGNKKNRHTQPKHAAPGTVRRNTVPRP
jgi:hypothetical protein